MAEITVKNLHKSFGDNIVFSDFDISFSIGSRTCVTGESGCGKTTLLNIFAGLEKADSGVISGLPDGVSAVFQEDRLCESFNAVTNVKLALRHPDIKKITAALESLGLAGHLNVPVRDLSGGMRRRVSIVRAIIAEKPLLLLDEPFTGLDSETRKIAAEYIVKNTVGKTVIAVIHDKLEAELLHAEIKELYLYR